MEGKTYGKIHPSDAMNWDLEKLTLRDIASIRDAQLSRPLSEMDTELIKECDLILTDDHPADDVQMQKTWKKIQALLHEHAHSDNANRRKPKRMVLLFAVVTLLVLSLTAIGLASGLLPWKLILSWDGDTLNLRIEPNGYVQEDFDVTPSARLGDEMLAMLKKHDMHVQLPSYIPAGFELDSVEEDDDLAEGEPSTSLNAIYKSGEDFMAITIYCVGNFLDSASIFVEKDEKPVETIQHGGTGFLLFENLGSVVAQWQAPPYVVIITGDITQDELKTMIQSIKY